MAEVPAPAAEGVLRILSHLSQQRGPLPAATIATTLGIPRSRTYQLLGILERFGFVVHFPAERRWGLGYAASELGSGFTRSTPIAYLGAPQLARVVARLGETAHLTVLVGAEVVYLVEHRAPRRPSLVTDVGVRLPGHLTASGRAILSRLPRRQVVALYPDRSHFVPRTPAPQPRSPRELATVLAGVRSRGWAEEDDEVTEGFASVAVPVLDHSGWPIAAIAVTFPSGADVDRAQAATEIGRAAAAISRALGATRDDAP
ncbi:MAG: IclR family transcriptional regulator [Microbacterium sp.]